MTYHPDTDPATIPDSVLYSELGRRRGAMRKTHGAGHGRPSLCGKCGRCHNCKVREWRDKKRESK